MPQAHLSLACPFLMQNQAMPPTPPPRVEGGDTHIFKMANDPCSPLPPAYTLMGHTLISAAPTVAVQAAVSRPQG